ncbi:MAG: hypothetical protein ACE5HD_11510 [Acidobacteriota bacterium]
MRELGSGPVLGPVSIMVMILVLPSCTLLRPGSAHRSSSAGPLAIPGPPAPVPQPAPPPLRAEQGLATARAALLLGMGWEADDLLAAVRHQAALESDPVVAARSLYLRGVLALDQGRSGRERARRFLEESVRADPAGSLSAPARLALRLLEDVMRREAALEQLQQTLATSERRRQDDEVEVEALRAQVGALKDQLDQLKEVHLRIESEKKDAPS